jgi:hypothetical protein
MVLPRGFVFVQLQDLWCVQPDFQWLTQNLLESFFDKFKQTVCSATEHKEIGGRAGGREGRGEGRGGEGASNNAAKLDCYHGTGREMNSLCGWQTCLRLKRWVRSRTAI